MSYSLESYVPQTPSQEKALVVARKVLDIAQSYSSDRQTEPAIVVFSGKPGVGKTHLLEGIHSGLESLGVSSARFSGNIDKLQKGNDSKIIVGDDAFSNVDNLSRHGGAHVEMKALNDLLLYEWYPSGQIAIFTSNFSLAEIQTGLTANDSIGRASSRLDEMARRGADVPIEGPDHRASTAVKSLF